MKKKLHILLFGCGLLFLHTALRAQSPQDCFGAIPVCQNTYSQSTSYTGFGSTNELNPTNQGCLTTGENNSVWYIVNVTTPGTLTFTLAPNATTADYDFAVYDITDKSCTNVANGLPPIRCNYASLANSSAGGNTGLSTTSVSPSLGAAGPSFSSALNVVVGQTFLILINNASSSASGYNLNFGGTASVFDNVAPTIKADTIQAGCSNPNFIMLQLSENIMCSSLATNGSDFTLSPANATITGAVSQACTNGSSFTNLIQLNFSNPLPPGNYTLSVVNGSDANTLIDNCNNAMPQNTTRTFVVQQPVQVNVTTLSGCAGTANGVITASGHFGTPPYQFRLNNGPFGNNNVFSGLPNGTYIVRVRDANGCIDDTTVTLSPANPILISNLQISNPVCFGQNTGSVTITASGGNPPLEYSVNTQPYQASNTIGGLGPGNFIVHVRDGNGCTKDSVIFISAPGQISFNGISITQASCGQNNGAISANGFGGTAPLVFSLNSGPSQASGNFSALAAGSYTLRLTDANACFRDTILQIQQQGGVTITALSLVQPSCTVSNGIITVNVAGGIAPILYSLNGGAQQALNVFSNLSSGTYTIVATDANGCTSLAVGTLVSPSNLFFGSSFVVQPTCSSLGSIIVQGAGGAAPLSYSLNTGPYTANANFQNLGVGTYTVHLQDANNCIHDTIITLGPIPLPIITSITATQPSCSFPNSGGLAVNVTGGTPIYTYSLNAGAPQASNSYSNLSSGNYSITVTDANGCSVSSAVTLTQLSPLNFSQFSKTDVGCFGAPLGSITSAAANGNPAYQYSLNGGASQASGNFSNLAAGNYTVQVTDASGCTITSVVTINTSAVVQINSVAVGNSPCAFPTTGTIGVNATVSNPPILYSVSPGGSNATGNFTGLAGGNYIVTIADAAGCTATSAVTITAPPPMFFTNVVVVFAPCFGGVGSISLLGAGGTPPYLYNINSGPFGSNSSFTNLPAGTYTIRVQDANGCFRDTLIDIVEPADLLISNTLVVNAACNSLPTGSVTVTATGGVPPYQFRINNGVFGTNNSFTNLGAGTYSIDVRDANNCIETISVTVTANGNFSINALNISSPSCFGGNDGAITFGVTGGISPYQYSINLGAYQTLNSFTGLSAGSFNLRAIDNSGCFDDTVITLTQPTAVTLANIAITNPACHGSANGSLTITAAGGTPPYNYSVNNGPFGSANTIGSLAAGNYTIIVRDANNCTASGTATLTNPPSVFINGITIINPGCLGGGGTISFSGLGGSAPYTFSIDGINYTTPGIFSNLPGGTYTLYIKDANGCIDDSTLSISGSAAVTISSLSFSKYVCAGQMNGTINVAASSSNPPLLYNIIPNPQQVSGNFSNLAAGVYTVRSEDNQGCYTDTTVTILQAPLTAIDSVSVTNATCANTNNGALTIFASGGVQPLSYQLGGSGYTANNNYNNRFPGTYFVYARDSAGCIVSGTATISSPPPIVINSIVIQQPFCSSATDGQISINVSGGVPPYLYAINASLFTTSSAFTNLIQGVYIVRIRDANNCQKDTTINLVANNYMQFTNISVQNVSCAGGNNGQISLQTTGGTAPYNYSINNISNGLSGTFSTLSDGQYTIRVTDNLGCQKDSVFTITAPQNGLALTQVYMTPNICKGDSSGEISVTATGGTAPYQFSIGGVVYQASSIFSNLLAGGYQIFVKDANGCIYDSIFQVTEPDTSVQIILIGTTPQSCVAVDDGTIRIQALFGKKPYNLTLNGQSFGADTFFTNLAPGNYIVEVTDNLGCKSTGKYFVQPSSIAHVINIDSVRPPFCRGDADGFIAWSTDSPYPTFDYTFNGNFVGANNSANNLSIGNYTITLVDNKGCRADTTLQLTEANPIDLTIITTPANCEGVGEDGGARAQVAGGEAPYNFTWSSTLGAVTDTIAPVRYGNYVATVTDNLGCSDTTNYIIDYKPCCRLTLPNAFTPNGDMNNDVFRIIGYGQLQLQYFEIFNRWGNKVFYTTIIEDGWDGTYKNEKAEVGTYYYVVKFKCHFTGREEQRQGDVILIR